MAPGCADWAQATALYAATVPRASERSRERPLFRRVLKGIMFLVSADLLVRNAGCLNREGAETYTEGIRSPPGLWVRLPGPRNSAKSLQRGPGA